MPGTILVGGQWGDEGKCKITDLIGKDYDYVVRCAGGNNAGHTVFAEGHKLALHLVPSSIIYRDVVPIIGNGVVIDPRVLVAELDELAAKGIDTSHLIISGNAHVIMPYHIALDGASELRLGKNLIGTTKRGIGPCYQDKAARTGIRMQDLCDAKIFRVKLEAALHEKNEILTKVYNMKPYTVEEIATEYEKLAERLAGHIQDITHLLHEAHTSGKSILFEGAQATLLDIDHGTYPFVTSSNCTAGGALTGSGVGPKAITRVLGIVKAYLTRVGSGPFPTELFEGDEFGDHMAAKGHEYGTTTGRRRRCGWYDAVAARYACEINGLTDLAVTKLDVLSDFDEIKVATAYEINGKQVSVMPENQTDFHHAKPIYTTLPGWKCDITQCTTYESLPQKAKDYLAFLEEQAGVPITIISVGPNREQTITHNW